MVRKTTNKEKGLTLQPTMAKRRAPSDFTGLPFRKKTINLQIVLAALKRKC